MISVGVDVSKQKSMICMLRPYGEVVASPYEISHTKQDLTRLIERIKAFEEEVLVVMEATGAYHLPVLKKLKEADIFVSVINPLMMKKYSQVALRKGKTDKLDSVMIANYGLDNWFKLQEYISPSEVYSELKLLGRQYDYYMKLKVQGKISLTNMLDKTMPSIKALIKSRQATRPTKDKLNDFVRNYWHYDNITKMSENKFIKHYCAWAKKKGYHAQTEKAKEIYALAKAGIPTLSSKTPSTKMLVLESVRVLSEVNKTLEIILTRMQELAKILPEYDVVINMQGVGDILAPRLIAEIGDARRFHSGKALIAYAGIDAPPYQSGNFYSTQRKISKRGSSALRKTGFEVMKCLKNNKPTNDSAVYDYMIKKENEGKHKKCAKIAALNKFLRIYYARVMEVYAQ